MKRLLIAAVLFSASLAQAEDITVSGVNLASLVDNTRIGVALPLAGGRTFQSVYAPMLTLHDAAGINDYAAINVGAAAYTGTTKGYVVAFPSLRIDTLIDRLTGVSDWMRAHVTTAKLPKLEAGVGGLLFKGKVVWVANIAVKF